MKAYTLLILVIICLNTNAQQEKKHIDKNLVSKWSLSAEIGLIPVKSVYSKTINTPTAQLGLNYSFDHTYQVGVFGQTYMYYYNADYSIIDNKTIDLNSTEYNSVGLSLGYIYRIEGYLINPKIDLGYNFLIAKAIDFNIDKTSFLEYRYISFNPKLYLGLKVTDYVTLGVNFGYNRQLTAIKGQLVQEFNPNVFNTGVYFNYNFKNW